MMHFTRNHCNISAWLVCCALVLLGTNATPLSAQSPAVPTSHLAWTQDATSAELPELSWAIYLDGARTSLTGSACLPSSVAGKFDCQAPVPAMTPGVHTIELVAIRTIAGTSPMILESPKSAPFQVRLVVAPAAPTGLRIL